MLTNNKEIILFHRHDKKDSGAQKKPLKDLVAIVASSQLLAESKRKELIAKIMESSTFEAQRFDTLCLGLINNFVNHCQRLPEAAHRYYALLGGVIDHALNRTEAALSLFRQFVEQDPSVPLSEEQQLWLYALFSAGILQGIGKLQADYRVDLFDMHGHFLKTWCPLLENLVSSCSHYHFEFLPESDEALRCRLNILMARFLMPASAYAWIISNPEVLAVWLALLSEDAAGAGTLGAILIRADAIAVQRYYNDALNKGFPGGPRGGRISHFVDNVPDSLLAKEQIIGMEFIKWLTQQLASKTIMVNKAPLLMVPGGFLMCVDMYKLFVRQHPEFKNWQAVQAGFLSLGLHRVNAKGGAQSRFEQTNTHKMYEGVVFSKYAIALPDQVHLNDIHTGVSTPMGAIELIHLMQFDHHHFNQMTSGNINTLNKLSLSGKWLATEAHRMQKELHSGNPK